MGVGEMKGMLIGAWFYLILFTLLVFVAYLMFNVQKIRKHNQKIDKAKAKGATLPPKLPWDTIRQTIRNRNASPAELEAALQSMAYHYPLPPRVGDKIPPEAKKMLELIFAVLTHKSASRDITNAMFYKLIEKNPRYGKELSKGLKA